MQLPTTNNGGGSGNGDSTVVRLSADTWVKIALAIVIQAGVVFHHELRSAAENERRFTALETTQAQLVKVVDRMETAITGRFAAPESLR